MSKNTEQRDYKIDYDLNKIFENSGRGIKKRIRDVRRMDLTDEIIAQLPFVSKSDSTSKANHAVFITDDAYDSKEYGGRLQLKIGVNSKVWYAIPARRGKKGAATIRIGEWKLKESGYYIKGQEANVKTARDRFDEVIKNYFNETLVAKKEGDMTIREYLESGQYKIDRSKTATQGGKIKEVTDKTLTSLLSQFKPWLDQPLNAVSAAWPAAFKKHWDERYIDYNRKGLISNPSNHEEKKVDPTTQRKYFMEIQAMFNIAEKKGYIERNWLHQGSSLFPKKNKKRGSTRTYKFEYEELFDFIYEEANTGTENGKLFISIMAITGCRNSEIYKNLKSNFELKKDGNGSEYFSMFIPPELCKTREAGSGHVQIKHPFVVSKLKQHLERNEVKESRYMFPSPTLRNMHCSDDAYRKLWQKIKTYFDLHKIDKLYSLRATLGTRVAKSSGIDVAANILRDSLETAFESYDNVDEERKNDALNIALKLNVDQNTGNTKELPTKTAAGIHVDITHMPEPVIKLWSIYKTRNLNEDGSISSEKYADFVSRIKKQFDTGKITGAEVEMWLDFQ